MTKSFNSKIDKKPYTIIARGDCTSRRLLSLNPDLFPNSYKLIQSEKSPFVFFLDSLSGIQPTESDLTELCAVEAMPALLRKYYLGQLNKSILNEKNADLLIIDTWADMNFEIYESKKNKWKCWIHPKYLRDREKFINDFLPLGRRSFEQSVLDAVQFVQAIRKNNPSLPVLILNQQVEFYQKMHSRMSFYDFGKNVQNYSNEIYVGNVLKEKDLDLADLDSCGPGQTLHFTGSTYRKMLDTPFEKGLLNSIKNRQDVIQNNINLQDNISSSGIDEDSSAIDFMCCSSGCVKGCGNFADYFKSLVNYVHHRSNKGVNLRYTPAVIKLDYKEGFEKWELKLQKVTKKRYLINRSVKLGYFFKEFNFKNFVPDIYAINTSSPVRSGGPLNASYSRSIEELGGLSASYLKPIAPKCNLHWRLYFGVFQNKKGHVQGEVTVDEQLIGYLTLVRRGSLVLYSQFMGHHEHLDNGIMYLLHYRAIQWIHNNNNGLCRGVEFCMYGGKESGGNGLWLWKQSCGFSSRKLFVNDPLP